MHGKIENIAGAKKFECPVSGSDRSFVKLAADFRDSNGAATDYKIESQSGAVTGVTLSNRDGASKFFSRAVADDVLSELIDLARKDKKAWVNENLNPEKQLYTAALSRLRLAYVR